MQVTHPPGATKCQSTPWVSGCHRSGESKTPAQQVHLVQENAKGPRALRLPAEPVVWSTLLPSEGGRSLSCTSQLEGAKESEEKLLHLTLGF